MMIIELLTSLIHMVVHVFFSSEETIKTTKYYEKPSGCSNSNVRFGEVKFFRIGFGT